MEGIEVPMTIDVAAPIQGEVQPLVNANESDGSSFDNKLNEAKTTMDEQVTLEKVREELGLMQEEEFFVDDNPKDLDIEENPDLLAEINQKDEVDFEKDIDEGKTEVSDKDEVLGEKNDKTFQIEDNTFDDVERLNEGLKNGSITPEMALAVILAYLKTQEKPEDDKKISILEMLVMFVARVMLEIAPGGEEELKKRNSQKDRFGAPGIGEIKKLLNKKQGVKSHSLKTSLPEDKIK